jgi:para-nitrobenzyl esterase
MIQSGSCTSRTPARAEQRGTQFAGRTCSRVVEQVSCLRFASVRELIEQGDRFSPRFVSGTPSFPKAPVEAVKAGRFRHVPIVIGANRDEGRTFAEGFIGSDRAAYEAFVTDTFGDRAADVLAHYRWPATPGRFTAAYLAGAIQTDAGLIAGIGGCPNRALTTTLARWTRVYAYEFDHRTGPGLREIYPGYAWGAGNAAELAYIWPSFNNLNGVPIAPTFSSNERRLAREMVQYWGAFTTKGKPRVDGQAGWPRFRKHGATLSLRAGGTTGVIRNAQYNAQHQCGFWSTMPPLDTTA